MKIQVLNNKIIEPVADGFYEIEKFKNKRTSPQNRYFHGYLAPSFALILQERMKKKVSASFAKEFLKAKCALKYIPELEDWIVQPTSKMNTTEFSELIDKSLKYIAVEWETYLESPDDWLRRNK